MTKPNLPTEKKLPTKAESLLAQASATVKKEAERKSALTAAGVKDIAKYDSAYAPLKNFDKDISSLYTEINDLGRFYTATDTELGKAKTNAQKMKNRIGQINSFLDTYGNLYDENTIKTMRSDLKSIDSTLTDWLGKASAEDYLTQLNSPASVDTSLVATAIRDKESEKARAERGGRDTTEITNELNSLYDNGGAYGAAAKRRNEYNANKVALATAKAELEKIAEGDPVERQKAWENGTSYQYEQEIANKLTEKRAEIDALEAKINLYESNASADDAWLKAFGSGEDLSAYKNVEYGKNEDPVYYLLSKQDSPSATMYNNFVKNGSELSDELKRSIKTLITDDERLVYNYLLETEGAKAARNWLDSLSVSEERNQRQGTLAAENLKDTVSNKAVRAGLLSAGNFFANVENWGRNLASLASPKATSAMTYAVEEEKKDIGKAGNAFIDTFGSIGNMAPSIAIGMINPIAGQASFGASAAGNAYNEARKEGKTVGQAALYGIVSGASEVFLQNILGGIPGISGASSKLANAAKNLKKPALRALAVYGIDAVGEATEEYLQEILDPMFRNVIFNEDNEIKIYTDEAAYSAMLGALTAGILNSPQLLNTVKTSKLGEGFINSGWYDDLVDNALKLDKSTDAYDLALKLKNGELKVTGDNVGELVRAYKDDGGDLSFTEKGGTIEEMPESVVTESVENLKAAPVVEHNEILDNMIANNKSDVSIISNKQAKAILDDSQLMEELGINVDKTATVSAKRNAVQQAVQKYHDAVTAQDAKKIASNAQNKTTTQTEGEATTEAQGEDADTFQYAHLVDKQKLGTRLIGELKNRTNKAGEKLADKLVSMATSITGDSDANRAVYKMFANPRYASAAALLHTDDVLEIVRNLETNSGKDFARKYMSNLTNATAFTAEWTKLLREDVNVTLENAVGMKPAENANAPSGYYDESDHRVAIADNLLTFEKVIGTIAHEGFHANGAIDRELVNNFAAYLKDNLYKNDWDTKVKLKKEKIEAYTGKPTTTEKAIEEVCAETITRLFNTQKAWDVMAEMFGNIEGSGRYLSRVKATVDRVYNNFKKMFGGKVPESKLTTFRDHLEHLIKETKGGYNPKTETTEESKTEAKKEATTEEQTDAKLEAELEAELAEESEQTATTEKNASVGNKMKPTESEAETKKAPVEDEEVELVSDLYDAEAKGVTATENKTKVSGERAPKQTAEGSKATSITISRDAFKVESVDDTQYDNYGYVLYPKTDMTADEIKQIVRELQEKLKNVPDGEYFYVSPLKTRDGKWEIKVTANYPSVVLSESALFDEVTSAEAKGGRMYSAPDTDIITPEQDRAYLDAVNRGDVETAQRMVDEAAKKAGYYSPLLYHGTKMFGFTKVKTSGVEKGMEWSPFFAANKEDISASYVPYGKVRDISSTMDEDAIEDARETAIDERKENITDLVYDFRDLIDRHISPWVFGQTDNSYLESLVEEANPEAGHGGGVYDVLTEIVYDSFYSYQDELGEYEEADDWLDNSPEGKEIISKILEIEGEKSALHRLESGEELGGIYQLYANLDNMYVVDGKGAAWNELRPKGLPKLERYGIKDAPYRTRDVAEWARENGYDGVIFKNIRDNGAYGRTPAGDVYAFFRPESQVKSADTITYDDNGDIIPLSERFNSENNDIRYSSADTDILLPELDSPSVSHSITTLESAEDTSGGRLYNYKAMEADEEEYRRMLKKHGGLADNKIEELFNTVDAIVDRIKETIESDAELAKAIDFGWERDIDDRAYSPIKQNSDKLYKVSLDFSTMCRKRILQQITQSQIQEAMDKTLDAKESIAVRQALAKLIDMGFQIEVACKLCYVESARLKSPAQIKKFLENKEQVLIEFLGGKSAKVAVKEAEMAIREELSVGNTPLKELDKATADKIREAKRKTRAEYKPSAEESKYLDTIRNLTRKDFTTPEGLENLAKNHYEIFNAYTSYVRNATKSKAVENDTWFRAGDTAAIGDKLIANMNTENGLRSQSWSDFQVIHLLDYIAATIELSTRGAKEQVYTKVPDFVKLMHGTNAMINLSLIPAKEYNGKLEYDKVEGMAFDIAMKLREKYPDVAGTICIGIANEQIQKLLASEDIDYVIPYHSSALNKHLRKAMDIPTWEDYQSYQTEKQISEAEAKAKGVEIDKENWHKAPSFSEWFDLKTAKQIAKSAKHGKYGVMTGAYMAMQNAADNYKRLCAERGLLPKFSYGKADFSNEENYWKLLIDRKMINQETGEIIEQKPLTPIFNLDEITEIMDDAIAQYPTVSKHQDAATEVVTKLFVEGKVRGDMSAEEIYSAVEKAVREETDNTTVYNILESVKDLDDGRMYSAEDTDIEETLFDSVNEYCKELARIYKDGYAEGKTEEEIDREADEFTRVHNARLAAQFGTIKQGEKPAREVEVTKRTSKEEKVSQTVRTILEAGATPNEALPTIERMIANGTFSYKPLSNKKLAEEAEQKIGTTQESFESALKAWLEKENKVSARDIVLGWKLYDYAANHNQISAGMEILTHIQENIRAGAQATQAARVLKMLSPEGQLYTAKKAADRLTDKLEEEGKLARKRFADKDKEAVEKIRKFAKRKGEEKVGNQLDKIPDGEQTEAWAGEVRSLLAESISRRIKPLNQVSMSRARGIASDLMQFAENTLPKRKGEKATPKTAAERIRDFFANREEYLKAWNEAKDVLKEKYAGDAESLEMLDDFFNAIVDFNGDRADTVMMRAVAEVALNKDTDIRTMMQKAELGDIKSVIDEIYNKLQTVVDAKGTDATLLRLAVQRWVTEKYVATHPLTQKQIDALIRKKLTQACGNINSIIRQNGAYKGEQLQMITAMLINEFGISNEAAITAAEKISERYNFVLDKASQIALKNAVKERKPGEKKSLNELFEQYANMGAFTGDYNEAVTAKLFDREGIKVNTALAEAYLAATTEEGRKEALYAIYKDLGSQMPSTFADKFNAWRYLAMLGNLRTHVRNVFGNAVFAPVVLTKDLIATGIEQGLQAATKGKFEASKSLGVFKDGLWEAAMKDAKLMSDVISSGQKYEDLVSANEAIKEGRVIFDKKYLKWVEYLRKKNSELLETEDVIFSSRHYAFALAQYCSAKGITSEDVANGKIPDEARAYAIKEAQKATFRDLNWFSKKLSGLRVRGDNALSKAANIAIEGVLPFKKTPANILVRGFEYGPAGLVKSIYDMIVTVRKGEMSASEAIDEMSAGLTGTGLLLLGMLLASKGLVEGASDDDEKKAEFDELTGHQSYALVLGNETFTIDWLAPAALPFFVGVEIAKLREREGVYTMAGITDIVLDVMGPMLELSCLQSLNDLIDSVRYAKENEVPMVALATAATGYFTQIFPTLLGQTERVGENKRMQTFTNKDSWLTSDAQYLLGKISAKIPGVDYQQIPYIDAWGRIEETGGIVERAFNNYINPSYVSEVKVSAMEQELQRLYEATKGENNISVYPKRAEKHFTVRRENPITGEKESEDYYLSADEYVQYATAKGTTAYKTITAFMEGPIYNTLDDKEKARAISNLYSYAEEYARTTVTDHEPEGLTKRAIEAAEQGIDFDTFFNAYVVQSFVEADKDFLGDAVTNSASNKKIDAINKITADPDERLILYKELDVGITAQNDAILDDAIDAKIKGDTTAYDAAIKRYIDNNKGADKKSAAAEYEKRIADIREELAKLSYDDPTEYEKQLEYYRSGAVAKDFSASKMSDSKKEWLDSYTDSLAGKLKKHDGDAKKTELIYAEAAKYGINERELKKRADKLK